MDKLISIIKGDTKKYMLVTLICVGGVIFEYYTGTDKVYKYDKKGRIKKKIFTYHRDKGTGLGWALMAIFAIF
jgi:hypothetical protein